jgi:hypothetical protein
MKYILLSDIQEISYRTVVKFIAYMCFMFGFGVVFALICILGQLGWQANIVTIRQQQEIEMLRSAMSEVQKQAVPPNKKNVAVGGN